MVVSYLIRSSHRLEPPIPAYHDASRYMSQQSQTVQTERFVVKLNGGSQLTDYINAKDVSTDHAELADGRDQKWYETSLETQ